MWIMGTDFFVSLVAKDVPEGALPKGALLVRARKREHLATLFPDANIVEDRSADYLYRSFIPVEKIAVALIERLTALNYPNYKNSVQDPDYHHALEGCWHCLSRIQHPAPYSERRHQVGLLTDGRVWEQPKTVSLAVEDRREKPRTVKVTVEQRSGPPAGQPEKPLYGHAKPAGKPSAGKKGKRK
jgi:hypothetical protein